MQPSKGKVMVAMSGGVDSSVAALLLLREGWEVTGAFMKNWSDADIEACGESCGWEKERQDALRVAATLGIPFETFDFEAEYRERVVGYMVREYAAGRTPNPDVMCNKEVKFDLFLKAAAERGFDMMATGHYARVGRGENERMENENGTERVRFTLLAGVDPNKDQSYFLHRLTQSQLAKTLFPVGHLPKPEVRRIAREAGLPTAEKKDSQGICFVGKVDLAEFLRERIAQRPGPIVTVEGVEIGRHEGLAPFTVGQRHGFGGGGGTPYFVARKDAGTNTLVVAPANDLRALHADAARISDMHWISGDAPALPLACEARIRYRQPLQRATVEGDTIRFAVPQRAVTPGQFAVLYDGERCLGGGTIEVAT